MKKILLLFVATCVYGFFSFGQTASNRVLDCTEVQFWQQQLTNNFKTLPRQSIDETEFSSKRKIVGFETCTYRFSKESKFTYVDGKAGYPEMKDALAYYNKVKKQLAKCLALQKYKAYAEETEDGATYQVFNKGYGKKGGYFQLRVTVQPSVKYENNVEVPNGFEVTLVMELRKEGAAG